MAPPLSVDPGGAMTGVRTHAAEQLSPVGDDRLGLSHANCVFWSDRSTNGFLPSLSAGGYREVGASDRRRDAAVDARRAAVDRGPHRDFGAPPDFGALAPLFESQA